MNEREMDCDCAKSMPGLLHLAIWEVKNRPEEEGFHNAHYEIRCTLCGAVSVLT